MVSTGDRTSSDARSVADLLGDLRDETVTLLRQEVALAKTEVTEKATVFGRNAAYLAVGGLVAYLGAAFILLAITYLLMWGLAEAGLDDNLALWLAPLLVGVVVVIGGYAMIQKALHTLRHESVVPEKTVHSLQENREWAQQKLT